MPREKIEVGQLYRCRSGSLNDGWVEYRAILAIDDEDILYYTQWDDDDAVLGPAHWSGYVRGINKRAMSRVLLGKAEESVVHASKWKFSSPTEISQAMARLKNLCGRPSIGRPLVMDVSYMVKYDFIADGLIPDRDGRRPT